MYKGHSYTYYKKNSYSYKIVCRELWTEVIKQCVTNYPCSDRFGSYFIYHAASLFLADEVRRTLSPFLISFSGETISKQDVLFHQDRQLAGGWGWGTDYNLVVSVQSLKCIAI
jgi:hypothetical protein